MHTLIINIFTLIVSMVNGNIDRIIYKTSYNPEVIGSLNIGGRPIISYYILLEGLEMDYYAYMFYLIDVLSNQEGLSILEHPSLSLSLSLN